MIVVVDFGVGNLRSVVNAFEAIGHAVHVTNDYRDLSRAAGIVLPGVGAFAGIRELERLHLIDALKEEVLGKSKPYLGICLGMQFLARESLEGGRHKGFGWINGTVRRIEPSDARIRVPHIGWNDVRTERDNPLFEGLDPEPAFYFVHSYHLEVEEMDAEQVIATCWHGTRLVAAVQQGNIFGVQFHPEKSQQSGLHLLKNFVKLVQ